MINEGEKFLDTEAISIFAKKNLPPHYRLGKVRFNYSSEGSLPNSLEIQIEYQNLIDESLQGTKEDIKAHQAWADPLIKQIRTQWPAEEIRISFAEKLTPSA